jgi:two-component system cell cycle response regulator
MERKPTADAGPELATENQALRGRVADLQRQAGCEQALLEQHQAFDLKVVGATSFVELADLIFRRLPGLCALDTVTLSLLDEGDDILTVMEKMDVDLSRFPALMLVPDEAALGFGRAGAPATVRLGRFDAALHGAAFACAGPTPASVALLPLLRNRRLIGALNLGSVDPSRLVRGADTALLEHVAAIIAICLENVISNEMLKYIGLTDALTGAYNRRYIDRRLPEEIARARRQGYCIACMYIDLDHFKRINDSIGHPGGDEVLRQVAARVKDELRLSDALGRYGGEEFIVLLIDADLASAVAVAERIRAGIGARPFDLASGLTRVSVSIGVTSLADTERDASVEVAAAALIGQADAALYQAKSGGRDRVVSFAPPAPDASADPSA